MEILLVSQSLAIYGGSETYLLTVANELQRLGHEVSVHAPAGGEITEVGDERGIRVLTDSRKLPREPEIVLTQDAESAYSMAARYPGSGRVYVAHSPIFQSQRAPQVAGVCHAVVALNDHMKLQCEAAAADVEVVRMCQPVDLARFTDRGGRDDKLRRVLLLGNHFGNRAYRNHRIVEEACEGVGATVDHLGAGGRRDTAPELEIPRADVVVGLGRCVVETMACGRAAYVFGNRGGDGWVTNGSYASLEARGFAGVATDEAIDATRLRRDLERFDADMGQVNRHLAVTHHDAVVHAAELVALFKRLDLDRARTPDGNALGPLARMVRVQRETDRRVALAELDGQRLRVEAQALRRECDQARLEHEHLRALTQTRRWRFLQWLGAPLDRLRRPRAGPDSQG